MGARFTVSRDPCGHGRPFIFQLFSSGWLERFDPGDPKSVHRLDQ